MDAPLAALQQRLGHRFADPALLGRALTHRSAGAEHNERLEFLGDAVLQAAISSLLYDRFAGSDEGDLTRVRAHLVREDSLARVALEPGPARRAAPVRRARPAAAVRSGRRSSPTPWKPDRCRVPRRRLCRSAGTGPARCSATPSPAPRSTTGRKDPKTELQEWLQARKLAVPAYRIVATRGQSHAQTFDVECAVAALGLAERGEGRSRRSRRAGRGAAYARRLEG